MTFSQVKVPRLSTDALYSLPTGVMVQYADGALPFVPAYAPGYWDIKECAMRAQANPYALHRH